MSSIHIGTSGWSYRHWRGIYYPKTIASADWLKYYADDFSCVELNSSFYRLPGENTIASWVADSPNQFRFAVKVSRLITHYKKLYDCADALRVFFGRIEAFGPKLGPVLFQLPPKWHQNLERLQALLSALPETHLYVFEFRDETWQEEQVYTLLKQHNIALCLSDLDGQQSPDVMTADFTYLRLHGPKQPYAGSYTDKALEKWSHKILHWQKQGKSVFVFFNNDVEANAIRDAKMLKKLCHSTKIEHT